jgi:hypothetical protein
MKKVLTIGLVAFFGVTFTSCEKCSTCTTISEDPNTFGQEISTELCDNGRDYDDLIEIYTRSGWECTEN